MEAVHADWKEYLSLLICEESHLKHMEDYHQVPAGPRALLGALGASVPVTQGHGADSSGAERGRLPRSPSAHASDGVRECALSSPDPYLSSLQAGAGESDPLVSMGPGMSVWGFHFGKIYVT